MDMIALLPFNLIFGLGNIVDPRYIIDILRINRVLLIGRLESLLTMFASNLPQTMKYITFLKPIVYLAFVWHATSCLWIWFDQVIEYFGSYE